MKSSEIIKIINHIEENYPVGSWTINDIHVWPIIRIKLFNDLCFFYNFKQDIKKINPNMFYFLKVVYSVIKSLVMVAFVYLVDYKNNAKISKSVDIVFLAQDGTYIKLGDVWYDRILDPIVTCLSNINKKSFILFQGIKNIYPRYNKSKLIEPHLIFYGMFLPRLLMIVDKETQINLEQYSDVVNYLKKENIPCNIATLSVLKKYVFQIRTLSKFYKRILLKLKPKAAFLVAYYGPSGYAFNLACRELNITSIDVQHGVQGKLHRSYGSWNNVPRDGYELLPKRFFCWTNEDSNIINEWANKTGGNHSAISIGNLFLKEWLEGNAPLINYYDNILNNINLRHFNQGFINILYTMNGFEDDETIDNLLNIILTTSKSFFWWVRCHPCFNDRKTFILKKIREKGITNIEVDIATKIPLYAILRHVNIHVTECSSVVLEASRFNVPSIVTSAYGLELYSNNMMVHYSSMDYGIVSVIQDVAVTINYKENHSNIIDRKDDEKFMSELWNIMR